MTGTTAPGGMRGHLCRVGCCTEGEPVGDHDALVRLVAEAGLDADEAGQVLETGAYADDVRADESLAAALGISGVPFFVVDGKYILTGAQQAGVLLQVLRTARAQAHPLTLVAWSARAVRRPATPVPMAAARSDSARSDD